MAGVLHGYGIGGHGNFQLLKMMVEEIERGNYTPGSTFRKESELYVYKKFRSVFGRVHSNRILKSRLQILNRKYKIFSEIMNKPGISWDMKKNVVYGNEKLLREKYKVTAALSSIYHIIPDFFSFDLMETEETNRLQYVKNILLIQLIRCFVSSTDAGTGITMEKNTLTSCAKSLRVE